MVDTGALTERRSCGSHSAVRPGAGAHPQEGAYSQVLTGGYRKLQWEY